MSLIIAVPREQRPSERRVALDPTCVERLTQSGVQVRIEAECGHTASFHDDDYPGVTICDNFADVVRYADVVVKVVCPTLEEIQCLQRGSVLVCIMSAFQHLEEIDALCRAGITVLAMDHMPRTTRAQPMDALSSQATVAGYKAALLAAELSPRLFPMLTTAAGTIRPSKVLVIGAGVAGLQAIATARRLGAQVEGYDIRRAAQEQIESLGARKIDTGVEVEGAGGFARALRKDEKQKQHDVLAEHLAKAHVVISAASIPGRKAPLIITEDMVDGMLPESVIVDLAASTGGNCELTHIGEHYYHHETLIVGPLNLPSHGAVHASEMYSRNVYNMLELVMRNGDIVLDSDDDIIARCVVCHDGQITHAPSAEKLNVEHVQFGGATHVATDVPHDTAGWLEEPDDSHAEQNQSDQSEPATTDAENIGKNDNAPKPPDAAAGLSAVQTTDHSKVEQMPDANNPDSEAQLADVIDDEQQLADLRALDGVDLHADPDSLEAHLQPDDLTRIDGVGPALQECLYAFGFKRFADLANLDDDAIQKLTVQLELNDEVVEQNWRGQARQFMEEQSE